MQKPTSASTRSFDRNLGGIPLMRSSRGGYKRAGIGAGGRNKDLRDFLCHPSKDKHACRTVFTIISLTDIPGLP